MLTLTNIHICFILKTMTIITLVLDENKKQNGIETCTLLLTLTVFMVHSPPQVVSVKDLVKSSTQIYKDAWETNNTIVCTLYCYVQHNLTLSPLHCRACRACALALDALFVGSPTIKLTRPIVCLQPAKSPI